MLAELHAKHPRELRADFQQYYGLNIDGMGYDYPVLHAADLSSMLPRDSRCVRAMNPDMEWSQTDMILALIEFHFQALRYAMADGKDKNGNALPKPKMLFKSKSIQESGMDVDQLKEFLNRKRTVDDGN